MKKGFKIKFTKRTRRNLNNYDELIIKVDSKTNIMELLQKNGENEEKIKSYIVQQEKIKIKKKTIRSWKNFTNFTKSSLVSNCWY